MTAEAWPPGPLGRAMAEARDAADVRFETSDGARARYAGDESHHEPELPGAVALCRSVEEVVAVVRACSAYGVPMVPYGAGTGLEGGAVGLHGGVTICTAGLDRILRVSAEDMDASVEAGVTQVALNRHLRPSGLFFPVDPGAEATLGGMAATGASGTTTVRYGAMRDNVLAATVVLANGEVIRCGTRARKSAAGYDLRSLMVGSEGTLGIIVELVLRIFGVPETTATALCTFPDLASAVATVTRCMLLGIPVSRLELMDEVTMKSINSYRNEEFAIAPTVLVELQGSGPSVAEDIAAAHAAFEESGGMEMRVAGSPEEGRRWWSARHAALPAARALRPGARSWSTDVCVPLGSLAECIERTKADLDEYGCLAPIAGHVGDGNFHLAFVLPPGDHAATDAARTVHDRLVRRALSMGGTCTGEHGVGLGKREYLEAECGDGVHVMRRVKQALDPRGLLNPGKVIDEQSTGTRS